MVRDAQRLIHSLLEAKQKAPLAPHALGPPGPVVTLSRATGSWGDEIAQSLAQRLGVECYDKRIAAEIAEKAHVEPALMARLDEKVRAAKPSWLFDLITGQEEHGTDYLRRLVNLVLGVTGVGGVIVGRGAHLILEGKGVLRVRITGTPAVCATRVAEAEGISLEAAFARVLAENEEKRQFIREVYGCALDDPNHFDLTVSTDQVAAYAPVVELIFDALKLLPLKIATPERPQAR